MTDRPNIDLTGPPVRSRASADYVLRTAQQNMVQLSSLADQKASVVLGSSFVVATIVFSDAGSDGGLGAAKTILAATAVIAGIFSAVSLFPKVSPRDGAAGSNPLFFGSIARLPASEYRTRMRQILARDEEIYDVIVDDLHQASCVLLNRKFRWLQASYLTLIIGMLATLVAVSIG